MIYRFALGCNQILSDEQTEAALMWFSKHGGVVMRHGRRAWSVEAPASKWVTWLGLEMEVKLNDQSSYMIDEASELGLWFNRAEKSGKAVFF